MTPRKHNEDGSACWCGAEEAGTIGGLRSWKHQDKRGEFILSQRVRRMSSEEAKEAFGRRLQGLRKGRNMTQPDLAQRLGINTHHVYLLESGRNAPSLGMVQALAAVFGTGETELLDGIRFPKRGG